MSIIPIPHFPDGFVENTKQFNEKFDACSLYLINKYRALFSNAYCTPFYYSYIVFSDKSSYRMSGNLEMIYVGSSVGLLSIDSMIPIYHKIDKGEWKSPCLYLPMNTNNSSKITKNQ